MRYLLLTLLLLTTVVAAAGCGKDEAPSGASSVVPAGSLVYGQATLKPEGEQKQAVESLIERFPGEGDAGQRVKSLVEKAFAKSESNLSYEKDVEPWLGDEAAFFVTNVSQNQGQADGAGLIATDDEDAARDAIDKQAGPNAKSRSYKGEDYKVFRDRSVGGVVDGWVVVGTERAFKAVVDTDDGGDSISDDDAYEKAVGDATEDELGFIYVDASKFAQQAGAQAGAFGAQFARIFSEPYVATLHANEDGARLESRLPESLASAFPFLAEGTDASSDVPADSWLTFGIGHFGKLLDYYVDFAAGVLGGRDNVEAQIRQQTGLDLNKDVLGWMGDMAIFVRGKSVSELDGALTIETTDEAASGRLIRRAAQLIRRSAEDGTTVHPLSAPGGGEGVTLRSPDLPKPIHFFQRDGKVVVAYGDAAAKDAIDPPEKLGDTAEFQDAKKALAGDYDVSLYLAMAPVLQLVDSTDAGSEADWQEAKPYLEPLAALISGTQKDGDHLKSVFGVRIK
jgi:hypothetical protein